MKPRLDNLTVDIEFLLISVVQGVALAALGSAAAQPLQTLQYQYWPYIGSGLVLILFFWSQAIVHTLSFIRWPLNIWHTFLYFLAAFTEVIAFSQVTNPAGWYIANAVFFGLAGVLYWVDLGLIKARADLMGSQLYQHALREQLIGLWLLVPIGIIFNLVGWWQIRDNPNLHLAFGLIQLAMGFITLIIATRRFASRSQLVTE